MNKSRLTRTVVLGALVATLGIWWLGRAYEVQSATLLRFLSLSALFVAGSIVLALAGAATLRALRGRRPRIGLIGKAGGVSGDSRDVRGTFKEGMFKEGRRRSG